MSLLDFKGKAQALQWKGELADLNDETDIILHGVAQCLDDIKTESTGDPVEQLIITVNELLDAAADVVNGLRGLENAIDNIIDAITQAVADGVQSVLGKRDQATNL